jgi:DNA-3-methyladenine glycosylase
VNSNQKLSRGFYARNTLTVARDLIGLHLIRKYRGKRLVGRIVETEAYQGPKDLAAHSARGPTERNSVMFGPPGFAYVYLIYGMWNCVNLVTREQGVPHAVLIRALEPIANIDAKTWGPGLLCKAMHIDRTLNGADLCLDKLWIEAPSDFKPGKIVRAPRIGVNYAGEWAHRPWRFFDRDSAYVSTVSAASRRKAFRAANWPLATGNRPEIRRNDRKQRSLL